MIETIAVSNSERLVAAVSALDARATCQSATPGRDNLRNCWPAPAVSLLVLAAIVCMATRLGLNEEMTGTIYLYPYRLLTVDASTPQWSECAHGFFVQNIKPVFGMCIGSHLLPLLSKPYIPTLAYLPLWAIGSVVPHYIPILVNVIPTLIAAILLGLMALQVCRHDGLLAACLSVASMLLFPFSVLYGSLYLYESLPVTALFGVWWLLDRYNATGRSRPLYLAALLSGFACHQKFTMVFVLLPFFAAYAAVFGCRRLSFRTLRNAAIAACVFPVLTLVILCAYAAALGGVPQFVAQQRPASWTYILFAAPSWVFAALPSPGFSVAAAARLGMLAALLAQCARKVVLHFRRGVPQPPAEVLAALTLPGTLCGFAVIYRYNTGSLPFFPLLPFVAIIIGGLWHEAARWLALRGGQRTTRSVLRPQSTILATMRGLPDLVAQGLLVIGFSMFTLVVMAIRWPSAFEDAVTKMGYPRFPDQTYITRWLVDHQVREPITPTTSDVGVLEFLSEGRIRPLYVNQNLCDRLGRSGWERVLAATGHQHTYFLLPLPYFAKQQVGRRCDVGVEDFTAALRASGRSFNETPLAAPAHSWDFTLVSVVPAYGAPPS